MYAAVSRWLGRRAWLRPVVRRLLPPLDRLLLKVGWRATPWPTLLLETRGRNTGQRARTPLYYVDHGSGVAVVATNFGEEEPDWSRNLRDDPGCRITIGRRTTPCRANLVGAADWKPIFERFVEFYPTYRDYRDRAGRSIPIWILEGGT